MSVVLPIQQSPRYAVYTASEGQSVFAIPFPFQQAADLIIAVRQEGGFIPLAEGNYSIAGAGDPQGGSVTIFGGRRSGDRVAIIGSAVLARLTSVVSAGRFASKLTDDEFDRLTIIAQELTREIGLAIKVELGGTPLTFSADIEDGQILLKSGNQVVGGPAPLAIIEQAEEAAEAAQQSAQASAASAALAAGSAASSQAAAVSAAALVVQATAGFSGFDDGMGYDFGSITDATTYFDQDWGTI